MKNEFKTGEYCKFPNEKIPRVLDILRANDHPVWKDTAAYQSHHDIVYCSWDGDMMGHSSKEPEIKTELSRHDFMCKALRFDLTSPLLDNEYPREQVSQITMEIRKLTVDYYGVLSIHLNDGFKHGLSYTEWCQRLCIEPIGQSSQDVMNEVLPDSHPMKDVEPVFDPSKPWEFRAECSQWANGFHYIGIDHDGRHVVRDMERTLYFIFSDNIRNIPEFNASMLEVGEYMETEAGKDGRKNLIKCISDSPWTYHDVWNSGGLFYCDIANSIKGRKVPVEIKVKEL